MTGEGAINCPVFSTAAAVVWGLDWLNIALIACVFVAVYLLYRGNKENPDFNLVDLILNDQRRADFGKVIIMTFGVLSIWVVVKLVAKERWTEVVTLLPLILGVFVGARVLNNIFGKDPQQTGDAK